MCMNEKYSRPDWKLFLDMEDGGQIMVNHTVKSFAYKGTNGILRAMETKERLALKIAETKEMLALEIAETKENNFTDATKRYDM